MDSEVNVFISYSHLDEQFRSSLESHLSILKRSNEISTWSDRRIVPGTEWEKEISENLEKADLILLLISSDFIASDYCYDVEVMRAMEKHEAGEALVIPIFVRVCDWSSAPFSKIQALPKEAEPVRKWVDEDEAWQNVVSGIRLSLAEFKKKEGLSSYKFKGL